MKKGHINKADILNLFERLSYLEKHDAVAAVIKEVMPEVPIEELSDSEYYFTIYTIWKIIDDNTK